MEGKNEEQTIKDVGLDLLVRVGKTVESVVDTVLHDLELDGADHDHKDVVEGLGLTTHVELLNTQTHDTSLSLTTDAVEEVEAR